MPPRGRRSRFESLEDRWAPAIVLTVGDHLLQPNQANQTIPLMAVSTEPATDSRVAGFNLHAQIGENFSDPAPRPVFQGVDFTGGVWDAGATFVLGEAPVSGAPTVAQISVAFTQQNFDAPANGLVATLRISTVGIHSGTFKLLLADDPTDGFPFVIGPPSEFVANGGVPVPIQITNGRILIDAQNQAPVVDLNGIDQSGVNFNVTYRQGDPPKIIVDTDNGGPAFVSDADSPLLASLTAQLISRQDGPSERLSVNTAGTPLSSTFDAATGLLTVTGNGSPAQYSQVLRTLRYENIAGALTPGQRIVRVTASDGQATSAPADVLLSVQELTFPWHKASNPFDTDDSGFMSVNDLLVVVNFLRDHGVGYELPNPPVAPLAPPPYVDVDRNGILTINDALLVIQHLRSLREEEGELATRSAAVDQALALWGDDDRPAADGDDLLAVSAACGPLWFD